MGGGKAAVCPKCERLAKLDQRLAEALDYVTQLEAENAHLCQTRCLAINAAGKGSLEETAIRVEAGEGREDRLMRGFYVTLRKNEARKRKREQEKLLRQSGGDDSYLPDFLD